MPSASLVHSFPVPLGRRGTAAAAVIALHALLVAVLIAGLAVQMPAIDVVLPPPAVDARQRPEPPVGRSADDQQRGWTIRDRSFTDVELPPPPTVTGGGEVAVAPPEIVGLPAVSPATSVASVLRSEEPLYPAAARRLGEEGAVLVRVLVGVDGHAEQVELTGSSGYSRLDDAALSSVRRWLFRPAASGAGPVASWTTVRVVVRLTS
jgi:protein TonB